MKIGLILCHDVEDGKLGIQTLERIQIGKEFLGSGIVDKIVLSGGIRKRPGYSKHIGNEMSAAKIMKDYSLELGIPSSKIILEDLSEDTIGQLIFFREVILNHPEVDGGVIISHDYHGNRLMEESMIVLGKKYKEFLILLLPTNKKNWSDSIKKEEKSIKSFHKTFEGINFDESDSVINCLLKSHPLYNHSPDFYNTELKKMREEIKI